MKMSNLSRGQLPFHRVSSKGDEVAPTKPGCRECKEVVFHRESCRIREWAPSRFVKDEERENVDHGA